MTDRTVRLEVVVAVLKRFPPSNPLPSMQETLRYTKLIMTNPECRRRIENDLAEYPVDFSPSL